jgi:hypothetical protein
MAHILLRAIMNHMQTEMIVRIVFSGLFIGVLAAGYYLFKNFEKLFGEGPYENSGASGLNKVQVIAIWFHALIITAAFAFFGH